MDNKSKSAVDKNKPAFDPCKALAAMRQNRDRALLALGQIDGQIALLSSLCNQQPAPAEAGDAAEQ